MAANAVDSAAAFSAELCFTHYRSLGLLVAVVPEFRTLAAVL